MTLKFKGSLDDQNYLRVDDKIDQINKGMFIANNIMLLGQDIQKHLTHLAASFDQGDHFIVTKECLDVRINGNPNITHLISIAPGMFNDTDFEGDSLSEKIQSDI